MTSSASGRSRTVPRAPRSRTPDLRDVVARAEKILRVFLSVQERDLGAPAPVGSRYPYPRGVVPLRARSVAQARAMSPFHLVEHLPSRRVDRAQVEELMLLVHKAALTPGTAPVIFAGICSEEPPDAEIAAACPVPETAPLLLVLFGTQLLHAEPLPGLRGIRVRHDSRGGDRTPHGARPVTACDA